MPDVIVIGAGPAGAVAAALLAAKGHSVEVLERAHFPRFSIGESLLPQAMEWLEEAGLLRDVIEAGFQHKNGAIFRWGEKEERFDFREKSCAGWSTTFQVRRDRFDDLLIRGAERQGARVSFGQTVVEMTPHAEHPSVRVRDEEGHERELTARFILDASGFGRVLARLLNLELPSDMPPRLSLFTHVEDNIRGGRHDRDKIVITINPRDPAIWYWFIPLAEGVTSVGVVGEPHRFAPYGATRQEQFDALVGESGLMASLLADARRIRDIGEIAGYSCKVRRMTGDGYALLGNAGEFLDPVFSSGVTIALKSASLAAGAVERHLGGQKPDWEAEFADPLKQGVETFRAFVEGWYDGKLQRVIFGTPPGKGQIKSLVTSVLAGYAWDDENPFVKQSDRYLNMLAELCS